MPAELAPTIEATADDRLLQAEAVVRAYCGWHIAPERTEVVVIDRPNGVAVLPLPSLHVTAITAVVQGGEDVLADDYTWTEGGLLHRAPGYLWGRTTWGYDEPLAVTMTHGYEEPPPAVTAVVQAMATRAVQNPGSLVRTQVGPFSDTYSQTGFNQSLPLAMLAAEKELLAPYVLPKRL